MIGLVVANTPEPAVDWEEVGPVLLAAAKSIAQSILDPYTLNNIRGLEAAIADAEKGGE